MYVSSLLGVDGGAVVLWCSGADFALIEDAGEHGPRALALSRCGQVRHCDIYGARGGRDAVAAWAGCVSIVRPPLCPVHLHSCVRPPLATELLRPRQFSSLPVRFSPRLVAHLPVRVSTHPAILTVHYRGAVHPRVRVCPFHPSTPVRLTVYTSSLPPRHSLTADQCHRRVLSETRRTLESFHSRTYVTQVMYKTRDGEKIQSLAGRLRGTFDAVMVSALCTGIRGVSDDISTARDERYSLHTPTPIMMEIRICTHCTIHILTSVRPSVCRPISPREPESRADIMMSSCFMFAGRSTSRLADPYMSLSLPDSFP